MTRLFRILVPNTNRNIFVTLLLSAGLILGFSITGFAAGGPPDDKLSKVPSKVPHIVRQGISKAAQARATRQKPDLSSFSNSIIHISADGDIELLFHAIDQVGANEEADLSALGGTIVYTISQPSKLGFPPVGMIQAWMPIDQVQFAEELDWVVTITPPGYGYTNDNDDTDNHPINPIDSEGVSLHNADLAHALGITGEGVRVGVISDGVVSLADAQADNELPATVTNLFTGSRDEGTAMLEIVHDMAPGADLYFHGTGAGTAGHVTALANLVAAGVHVIAEDLAYDSEPAFQQGIVAVNREATAAGGIPVHSSAGNRGTNHSARVLAVGTATTPDGVVFAGVPALCPYAPNNVVAIAPGNDTTFDANLSAGNAGGSVKFSLQWSEPRAIFPTAGQGGFTDLDLIVMDAALTTCIAVSSALQIDGTGDTIEIVSIPLAANANINVKIIVNVSGTSSAVASPLLDLRWRPGAGTSITAIDATTRAGSINPDSNYTGFAYSIGAVRASNGNLESFSSAGPANLVTTTHCAPTGQPGPCPATAEAGPPALQFQSLDFLGADGVTVSGAGGFGVPTGGTPPGTFFGTSAGAPHTAGCDALVRSVLGAGTDPSITRERLAQTAIDFNDPGNSPGEGPGEDPATGAGLLDCLAAVIEADVSIVKSDNPDPVHAGEELTYTLTITNQGPDTVGNIVVGDTLPAEVSYIGNTGGCDISNLPVLVCDVGTLGSGASTTIDILVAVASDLLASEADGSMTIDNVATVAAIGFDPDLNNNEDNEGTFIDELADLSVTKTCKPDRDAVVGEDSPFCEIVISNNGPSMARDVTLNDAITASGAYTIDNIDTAQGSCSDVGGDVGCDLGGIDAGDSVLVTVHVLTELAIDINDTATVATATPESNYDNNTATGQIHFVLPTADLVVSKQCQPVTPAPAGSTASCEIFIYNAGPQTAENVKLNDEIASDGVYEVTGVDFSAGLGCTNIDQDVDCLLEDINAGDTVTVIVEFTSDDDVDVNDIAIATSDTYDPDPNNNTATGSVTFFGVSDLWIRKLDYPDPVIAGTALTYRLRVDNHGPSDAVNVLVSDFIPFGTLVKSARVTKGSGQCVIGVVGDPARPTQCGLGTIPSDTVADGTHAIITIKVMVLPTTRGVLHNDATVSSDYFDDYNGNNQVTAATTIIVVTSLDLVKYADKDEATAGAELRYVVMLTNVDGPSTATGVMLIDQLPEETSWLETKVLGGVGDCYQTNNGIRDVVTCSLNNMDPGETFTVVITVLVDPSVPDGTEITNVADSTSDDGDNDHAEAITTVNAEADLWIDKTGGFITQNPGKNILYTLTVHNDSGCSGDDPQVCGDGGPSDAQNVVVYDLLPVTNKKLVVTFVSEDCVYNPDDLPRHSVTCTTPVLAAGDTVFHQIEATPRGRLRAITNIVDVSSDTTDPDTGNNHDEMLMIVGGGGQKGTGE